MLKKYLTKKMGRVMVAAAMAAALVVPAGVQAATTYNGNTGWLVVPYNTTQTTQLICGGKYNMGKVTVTSTGTESVTKLNAVLDGKHSIYAGKSKDAWNASSDSGTGTFKTTYSCKGAAYGYASGSYTK